MALFRCAHASSSARFFVQLARRSTTSASPSINPIMDLLTPRLCTRTGRHSIYGMATLGPQCSKLRGCSVRSVRSNMSPTAPQKRRFATTAPRPVTSCVYNPQKDEDGNNMHLDITDRAGKRLSQIMRKDSNPNLALRIQVESGGCHGFQYLMSLVTLPPSGTSPQNAEFVSALGEDDTIFQYCADENSQATATAGAPKIVIDQPSLELLKGSKVDFTMELIGSQFKITDNPFATSACGCGTSFDIKM